MGDDNDAMTVSDAATTGSPRRPLVLVTSMHRSGTSACARLMNLRGLGLATDLMSPGPDNERGFWESRSLADYHDRFFQAVGHAHDSARALPSDAFKTEAAARLEQRLARHIEGLPASGALLVKDPRAALLLPVWLKVAEANGFDPRLVIMVRNPLEVAASLDRRNRYSFERSVLLWLRHMVSVERGSRRVPRVFVSYTDLLGDWQGQTDRVVERLSLELDPISERISHEGDEFLSPALQHHAYDDASVYEEPRLFPWAVDAFDCLRRATRDDVDQLEQSIDAIAEDLARAGDILEAQISRNDARIFELAARQGSRDAEVEALEAKLERQARDFDHVRGEASALREQLIAVERERKALRASEGEGQAALHGAQARLGEASRMIEALNASVEGERQQSAKLRDRIADLSSRLQIAEGLSNDAAALDQVTNLQEEARQQAERHRQAIGIAEGQLARSQEDLLAAERKLALRDADVQVAEAARQALEGRIQELSVELQRRQDAVVAADVRIQTLRDQLQDQSLKTARLEVKLEAREEELTAFQQRTEQLAAELEVMSTLEAGYTVAKAEITRLRAERARGKKAEKRTARLIAKLEKDVAAADAISGQLRELSSALEAEQSVKQSLEADLVSLREEVRSSVADRGRLVDQLGDLAVELDAERFKARGLEQSLSEAERVRGERDALAIELGSASDQLSALKHDLDDIRGAAEQRQVPAEEAAKTLAAELEQAVAKADWLEGRLRNGHRPKSKIVTSLMKSSALIRVPAVMLGLYDASIARNPVRSWRVAVESEEIRRSGLFDEAYYRDQNWDVDLANEDAVMHYVVHGAWEGRNPSRHFDSQAYLDANPDVAKARINPLFHYTRHGRKESRPARHVPDLLGQFRPQPVSAEFIGDPYGVRPDDCILPESQRGEAFLERFELLGGQPDFAGAIAELNSLQPSINIIDGADQADVCATIVIPVYGQLGYTLNCLHSLALQASTISCEVIVVDDCSPDETAGWIPLVEWVRYVRQPLNGGFISSSNLGASSARGQYVVMLNNDTRVAPGWLDEIMNSFRLFPKAGLVGSKLFYPDGSLQEAGGIVWKDGSAWNYGRNDDPNKPEYCYARRVDYISGASLAVPKWLWDDLGGFDGEHYERAYCEDADLAFKIRERGYETWFQPLSRVIHYEGKTSGTDVQVGEKAYQISNQARFYERWRDALSTHADNGVEPLREADRFRPAFCLVVDATTPTPDQDAGSVTVTKILTLCSRMGVRPIFVPQDNYLFQRGYTQDIQRAGAMCAYAPFQTSIDHVLDAWGGLLDYALVFRIGVAESVRDSIRSRSPHASFVFHNIDLHYLRMQREARLSGANEASDLIEAIKASELKMIADADCAIVHTDTEQEILACDCPDANIKVFTYMVDLEGTQVPYENRHDVMFLGGYNHAPNVDAVEFFVSEVWPKLRGRLPDGAKFYAVGANPPDSIRKLASEDVVVTGRVDELRPYFDLARVFVAPLRYGAGIKGKVATSMSFGVPSVITNIAAEGMGLRDGEEVLVRDEPGDIADAVVELYGNRETWFRLQDQGFDFVHRHYSLDAGEETLADIFASAELRRAESS